MFSEKKGRSSNIDESSKKLQTTKYIRKLDSDGNRLIGYKDCLWSAVGDPGIIKQWNSDGKCIRTLEGHTSWINSLFIWRDCLYSASWDSTIRVWSIITGQCVRQLVGHTDWVCALIE